ncbi:MAG TPA: hypothetical protein VJ249_01695 [Candidatus Bathyarchaeia archaeon]|nr:hypothetical protein [Candidatus Bathyarchaeia archaeon]
MAMEIGAFFENVVLTFLLVITFFFLVLVFLYMIFGKEEKTATATTPKTKTSS